MDTRTARPSLPAVHRVLEWPGVQKLCENYGKAAVTDAVRHVLAEARAQGVAPDDLGVELSAYLERWARPSLRRVFNLTGTVLHTNLGRARLPEEAIEAMAHAARTPCNLEFDVERGRRGQRDAHIETLICELTGAEAATFVNNNAASVLLILNTLALGREVPISRGELIEIGGAFRMPDIMAQAGCLLREVGTTNRTHLKDFAAAISADTGCILTVHPSNYEVVGFTKTVSLPELAELASTRDLPLVSDLGSGSLVDLERLGLPREMTVSEVLSAGADLVCFSGDKLLGGPQAGIIAGKASLIAELNRNPMKRAMRLDKVTIAALEAVLRLYRMPDRLVERLPTLAQLSRSADALQAQAERVLPAIRDALAPDYEVTIEPCKSQIGSGALPVAQLPSRAIAVRPIAKTGPSLNTLSARFLALPIPVIGRTHKGTFWLDMRTLTDEESFVQQFRPA